MISQIKELRKLLPIPMNEAMQLLKDNNGDIEKSAKMFKANSIELICETTGCSEDTAYEYYEAEKFDFNRTVSSIREAIYDSNYSPIEGVTLEGLKMIREWIHIIDAEDFGVSLDYRSLKKAIDTLLLIPTLKDVGEIILKAKRAKDIIFEGYKDTDSLEEYVRRHRKLDDNEDFRLANKMIELRQTIIEEELFRHARNMAKLDNQ
ncbi:MAG: hypothetical protein E6767_03600 [Dysgonomonas sp.]|nr:hypothetical protein [Dysgonomonas sp.]